MNPNRYFDSTNKLPWCTFFVWMDVQYLCKNMQAKTMTYLQSLAIILESVRVLDQLRAVIRFKLRMAWQCDLQFTLGKSLVKVISWASGAHHIEPSLHNTARDVTNLIDLFFFQQPTITRKESLVSEVVVFNARESQAVLVRTMSFVRLFPGGWHKGRSSAFPHCPSWNIHEKGWQHTEHNNTGLNIVVKAQRNG